LWKAATQKIMEECAAIPVFELNQVWGRRAGVEYGHMLHGSLNLGPVISEAATIKR